MSDFVMLGSETQLAVAGTGGHTAPPVCPLQACPLCDWGLAYEDHTNYAKVLEKYNAKVDALVNSAQLTPDDKCQQSLLINHHLNYDNRAPHV